MAILKIVKFDEPMIRKTSRPGDEITPRIERLLDDMTAMMVNLTCAGGKIKMNIQMGCTEEIAQQVLSDVTLKFGTFTYDIMDEDVVINLKIEGGADR